MRVTSNTLRMAFLSALDTAQQRLVKTQTQVSTGRRVTVPSDDPYAAARIGELDAALGRVEQYRANGIVAGNRLGLEEQVLAGVVDNLQRVRELTLAANSDTLGNAERVGVAAEIRERLDSIVALANTTDAGGRYIFAGFSESTKPFVIGAGGAVTYNGDDGQRFTQINDERLIAINDSGAAVFQRIASGNGVFSMAADPANTGGGTLGAGTVVDLAAYVEDTYTVSFTDSATYEVTDGGGAVIATGNYEPGQAIEFRGLNIGLTGQPAAGDEFTVSPSTSQDVFSTLTSLIANLEAPATDEASRALLHGAAGQSIVDIDQALNHMIAARADLGARMHAVDEELASNDGFTQQMTTTLSELRDLDYAEALSLLAQQLLGLDAAQKAYLQTQNLSLFRHL